MPHLCRWCEFQSRLLFVISLLLKNFLTALYIIILVMDLDPSVHGEHGIII